MKKYLFIFALLVGSFFFAPKAKATMYFVDFSSNGGDSKTGLSTTSAFQSLDKFSETARSAGDIAVVRRGVVSSTNVTDLTFTSSGNLNNPITITADYDNWWSDDVTSTVTFTPTFGSKFMATSASTTDAFAGKWLFIQDDCYTAASSTNMNTCEFAYEIASSTKDGISLYLPYKGQQSGSGKNARIMKNAPQWNVVSGDFQWTTSASNVFAWFIKGIDVRSTDSNCAILLNASDRWILYDMVLQGNGATDCGLLTLSARTIVKKSRFFGQVNSIGTFSGKGVFSSSLFDCNNIASSIGIILSNGAASYEVDGLEVKNCTNFSQMSQANQNSSYFRNVVYNNSFNLISGAQTLPQYFEDDFGIPGLNKIVSGLASADTLATTTMSTSTQLHAGGSAKNLLVFPPSGTGATGISTRLFPSSYIKLFEYPIYADTTSKTYTMYFSVTSTNAFTTDPITSSITGSSTPELYIECEYYNSATTADRILKRSNTVNAVDFNGSTAWQSLSVTCQPTQSGVLYLRGWYAKPKEARSNWFLMDLKPLIQ